MEQKMEKKFFVFPIIAFAIYRNPQKFADENWKDFE